MLKECEIKPTVNQVEFHPQLYQKELLEYCQKNNIQLESYSPFAKGEVIYIFSKNFKNIKFIEKKLLLNYTKNTKNKQFYSLLPKMCYQ